MDRQTDGQTEWTDGRTTQNYIPPTSSGDNKANSPDTEDPFLDFDLSITKAIVSSKIYDKQDAFNFK